MCCEYIPISITEFLYNLKHPLYISVTKQLQQYKLLKYLEDETMFRWKDSWGGKNLPTDKRSISGYIFLQKQTRYFGEDLCLISTSNCLKPGKSTCAKDFIKCCEEQDFMRFKHMMNK